MGGDIGRQAVETKPAGSGQTDPGIRDRFVDQGPAGRYPSAHASQLTLGDRQTALRPKAEVDLLGNPVVVGQRLFAP